jgi:hypothetical protein
MNLNLLTCAVASGLALGVGVGGPARAQQYFNCEYSPRCEAIQNKQCEPSRTLKDKITLIRLHSSSEEVERTWAVLAGFEAEYCSRLGDRGNIVRDFMSFRAKTISKQPGATCADPRACADVFVEAARERWRRDDLEGRIKADLERASGSTAKAVLPTAPEVAAMDPIPPDSWQTTTKAAAPAKAATSARAIAPAKSAAPGKTRTVQTD